MKKIGKYTAKGTTTETESGFSPKRISLFDGRFDTGYRVVDFQIWSTDYSSSSDPDCVGKLATDLGVSSAAASFMNADDNREIAWAGVAGSTDSINAPEFTITDPDNLIVQDLFVLVRSAGGATVRINYIITMEKYEFSEWRGALAMVRNTSQDVD
jgi:hypothetical protein